MRARHGRSPVPEDIRLALDTVGALARTGLFALVRPDRLPRMAAAPLRFGAGLAALGAVAAARHPDHPAIADERGVLTYGDLDRRVARIAAGLREEHGVGRGGALAIMCRNHRGFVEAALAGSRCGADLLPLNTELPPRAWPSCWSASAPRPWCTTTSSGRPWTRAGMQADECSRGTTGHATPSRWTHWRHARGGAPRPSGARAGSSS